jgi:hypothetical protein
VEPGNYSGTSFQTVLTNSLNSLLTFPALATPVVWNSYNDKITLNLYGAVYKANTQLVITNTTILTFFDPTGKLSCGYGNQNCFNSPSYPVQTLAVNQTLGWVMGFRLPSILVNQNGNVADAIMDLNGPKYLILVIDDYNQNHINNGLIGITEYDKTLKLPTYYSPDIPYYCIPATPNATNLHQNSIAEIGNNNAGEAIVEKLNTSYQPTVRVLPSAPRTLTQAQIYTINEIMKNNNQNTKYRLSSPSNNDTFAIIPLKLGSIATGSLFVDYSGPLQDNKRIYFGPVNIERMRVKLCDDKGNVLNLNGGDWSVTLISENLYQY